MVCNTAINYSYVVLVTMAHQRFWRGGGDSCYRGFTQRVWTASVSAVYSVYSWLTVHPKCFYRPLSCDSLVWTPCCRVLFSSKVWLVCWDFKTTIISSTGETQQLTIILASSPLLALFYQELQQQQNILQQPRSSENLQVIDYSSKTHTGVVDPVWR